MSFTPETGAGVDGANSFVSLADAESYFSDRPNADWTALSTDAAKKAALMYATAYVEAVYRRRFRGTPTGAPGVRLSWPATDAYDDDGNALTGVPVLLVEACCELAAAHAKKSLVAPLGKSIDAASIGPLSVTYSPGAQTERDFAFVDRRLRPLLRGGRRVGRLVRG